MNLRSLRHNCGGILGGIFGRGLDRRDHIDQHAVRVGCDEVPLTEILVAEFKQDGQARLLGSRILGIDVFDLEIDQQPDGCPAASCCRDRLVALLQDREGTSTRCSARSLRTRRLLSPQKSGRAAQEFCRRVKHYLRERKPISQRCRKADERGYCFWKVRRCWAASRWMRSMLSTLRGP